MNYETKSLQKCFDIYYLTKILWKFVLSTFQLSLEEKGSIILIIWLKLVL